MLSQLVVLLQRLPYFTSLVRVNHFIYVGKSADHKVLLRNNYVFQHACKTPLTTLKCSIDLIKEGSANLDTEVLESADSAILRLTELINSVTSQNLQESKFKVSTAIHEVIILLKNKKQTSIKLTTARIDNLYLSGRKIYFQEMLVCMMNNAIEAYDTETEPHIDVMVQRKRNQLHIHVVDFASGMSLVAQKMACMQGLSYKESGMGLGLYFVKRTVEEEFLGKLDIQSKLGMGTHVHVVMPVE